MDAVFVLPNAPADLEAEEASTHRILAEYSSNTDAGDRVQDVIDQVTSDTQAVLDAETFVQLYWSIKECSKLSKLPLSRLLDVLCANLSASSMKLAQLAGDSTAAQDRIQEAGEVVKLYTFFVTFLLEASLKQLSASTAEPAKKGRKAADKSWNTEQAWKKALMAIALVAETDLSAVFRPGGGGASLAAAMLRTARQALPEAAVVKGSGEELTRILAAVATRYGLLQEVTADVVSALFKHEHVPPLAADLARHCHTALDSAELPSSLLAALLVQVDPSEYKVLAQRQSGGVACVSRFLADLAEKCPALMERHLAQLVPQMAGPHQMRSAIVSAVGQMLIRSQPCVGATSGLTQARLVAKVGMLQLLLDRLMDASAFTRARTLQVWSLLAEAGAVPMSHFCRVADGAVARLRDKGILVRKAALKLLIALMAQSPFGPYLDEATFAETLRLYERRAAKLETSGGEDAGGAAWELGDLTLSEEQQLLTQPDANPDEEVGDQENAAGAANRPQLTSHDQPQPGSPDEDPADGVRRSPQQLGVVVASLKSALQFTRTLHSALPHLQQLLASPVQSDVQEAIALLKFMKHATIQAADATLTKMLALVFAKDPAIRAAVLDAFVDLYVDPDDVLYTAAALTNLLTGDSGTLGTAASVQHVLAALLQQGSLPTPDLLVRALLRLVHRHAQPPPAAPAATPATPPPRASAGRKSLRASLAPPSPAPPTPAPPTPEPAAGGGAGEAGAEARGALQVVAMLAAEQPALLTGRAVEVLRVAFRAQGRAASPLQQKWAIDAIAAMGGHRETCDEVRHKAVVGILTDVLLAPTSSPHWHMVAQSAVQALYVILPQPGKVAFPLLERLCQACLTGSPAASSTPQRDALGTPDGSAGRAAEREAGPEPAEALESVCAAVGGLRLDGSGVQASALAHLFTVVGQVGMQHLCYVEGEMSCLRRRQVAAATAADQAAEAPGGAGSAQQAEADDLAEVAGGDQDLDALQEALDAELEQQLRPYCALVQRFCASPHLLTAPSTLQAAALLSLSKLMCISATLADSSLQLLFSLVSKRVVCADIRNNIVIALGDLLLRWPNTLEPWTGHMYAILNDPCTSVRSNTLMVLSHLILNDMMKVKGHISRICLCLQDPEPQVVAMAELLFDELSKRVYKGSNPIYNLLPDMLSTLSCDASLSPDQFRSIMAFLLKFIQKDKQVDSIVEKLVARLQPDLGLRGARSFLFCVQQLKVGDKGMRCIQKQLPQYKEFLGDEEFLDILKSITHKAKEGLKDDSRLEDILEFENTVDAVVEDLVGAANEVAAKEEVPALQRVKSEAETVAAMLNDVPSPSPPTPEPASPALLTPKAETRFGDQSASRRSKGSHAESHAELHVVKSEPMDESS